MFHHIEQLMVGRRGKQRATIIGIDGIDASGKTTFARSLASYLKAKGLSIQMVHLDDFHHPLAIRRNSQLPPPQAYYRNTFDYHYLITELLQPIHNGTPINKERQCLDLENDKYCVPRRYTIDQDTIVIVEGVFLFRPELAHYFSLKIHLHIDFDCCLARVINRDGYLIGSSQDIISRYQKKYIPGQLIYFQEANPLTLADLTIDNSDFANPFPKNC